MQTRRDQVQAHAFVAGRLVSAMLRAEPDAPATPLRRFVVGAFCGVLAGVILVAGAGAFGYLRPGGNKAFRAPGALIVAKETGSRYVLVDGALRPVLNYASAKLILGDELHVVSASRNSLKGVPHGLPVGIPSAPEALPEPTHLDAVNWHVCSTVRPDEAGEDKPFVTLRVGAAAPAGAALGAEEALLVATPDGTRWLAWNGRRLRVRGPAALGALGYADARPALVGPAWVNALPAGPDLASPQVPGRGRPGQRVRGRPARVGQVFAVPGASGEQFFLLARDGLAALSPTGAALALADPRIKDAYPGQRPHLLRLDAAGLAAAPRTDRAVVDPGLPVTPPALADNPAGLPPCLQITVGGRAGADVRVALAPEAGGPAPLRQLAASVGGGNDKQGGQPGPPPPVNPGPSVPAAPAGPDPEDAAGQADEVGVEPGAGLLVRALPAPGVADGAKFLLVDIGVRYPLPDDQAAAALGYADAAPVPVPVPTILLGLIPAGRPLDPEAAKQTQPIAPQSSASTASTPSDPGT
jgi:type VII secretion protein EccB